MKTKISLVLFVSFFVIGCARNAPEITMKEALKGKFHIGTALNLRQINGEAIDDVKIIEENFDAIVAENCMKGMYLQPKEGEFFFDDADKFVKFGERNNQFMTGHCLIWHNQFPTWFFTDEKGESVSQDVLKDRMKSHITTIVRRYKGLIKGWDVVNEAIMEDGSYRKSKFYEILGEEFIPLAFQYAQEADPDVELYYNDYNEWYPEKRKTVLRLIETLKERNIRIDAIGLQGHVNLENPSIDVYEKTIEDYNKAGVKVMITEFDISILPSPKKWTGAEITTNFEYQNEINPYTEGVPDDVMNAWNNRMADFFRLFLKHSEGVSRVTLWGVSDGSSWKNDYPVKGRTDYPLLFDRNYRAKPVVNEVVKMATVQ